jgi:hypothetical protein
MVALSELQLLIIGWVITGGVSIVLSFVTMLVVYSLYCLYKVIKNFSNKY